MNTTSGFQDVRHRIRKLRQQLNAGDDSIEVSSSSGSMTAQTDYNFALKRFLLDVESVVDENETLPTAQDFPHQIAQFGPGIEPGEPSSVTLTKSQEGFPSQCDKITDISCQYDGCILQDILASSMFGADQPDHHLLAGIHLYGYNIGRRVQSSSGLATKYVVAIFSFVPLRSGELAFEKGDVIQILEVTYTSWSNGRLGSSVGHFPDKYIAPCKFRTPEAIRLAEALQGRHVASLSTSIDLCKAFGMLLFIVKPSIQLILAGTEIEHEIVRRPQLYLVLQNMPRTEKNVLLAVLQVTVFTLSLPVEHLQHDSIRSFTSSLHCAEMIY